MDFLVPILTLIISSVFFIVPFVVLLIYKNPELLKRNRVLIESVTSLDRGERSERRLILTLLKSGVPAKSIFHDLMIEKSYGKFSQIDVAIATTEGIVVIEVKTVAFFMLVLSFSIKNTLANA